MKNHGLWIIAVLCDVFINVLAIIGPLLVALVYPPFFIVAIVIYIVGITGEAFSSRNFGRVAFWIIDMIEGKQ